MPEIRLRPALPSDAAEIGDVINAHSLATVSTRRMLFDADGKLRTARYIPSAAHQVIACAIDERALAHIYWISRRPHVVVEFGCTIHPDYQSATLGQTLLDYLQDNAGQILELAPQNARIVLQTTMLADDAFMRHLLLTRGFQKVRDWVHFELRLDDAPRVETSEGIIIREMDPRVDWPAVGEAMDAAFADHWGEMSAERRTLLEEDDDSADGEDEPESDELRDDPYSNSLGLCFVAESSGMVIGSCLCNAQTIEWPDSGKLGSLSVLREYRRLGVGRALTATALAEFHRRGVRRIITDTDSASFTGANRLYQSFGFEPYRYEQVWELELRPGVEWRALATEDLAG